MQEKLTTALGQAKQREEARREKLHVQHAEFLEEFLQKAETDKKKLAAEHDVKLQALEQSMSSPALEYGARIGNRFLLVMGDLPDLGAELWLWERTCPTWEREFVYFGYARPARPGSGTGPHNPREGGCKCRTIAGTSATYQQRQQTGPHPRVPLCRTQEYHLTRREEETPEEN